jgi:hypothetical protein
MAMTDRAFAFRSRNRNSPCGAGMRHRPQAAKIAAPLPGGDEMRALSTPNPDLLRRGEA